VSEENAQERLRGRLRDREGLWTCPQAGCTCPGPSQPSTVRGRSPSSFLLPSSAGADARPTVEPAGRSRS